MMRTIAPLATLMFVVTSFAAVAQDSDRPRDRGACRDDARKLCAGIGRSAGRGAMLDCLAGQKDKLSDSCRKSVEARGK